MSDTLMARSCATTRSGRTLLIGLGALVLSAEAMARCTAPGSNVNIAAITVQRDAPVGGVIGTGGVVTRISCEIGGSGASDNSWMIYPAPSNIDYGATTEFNVRKTAWPGVGIRWINLSSAAGNSSATWTRAAVNSYVKATGRGVPLNGANTFTDNFELVKIGPISSGIIPAMTLQYLHATPTTNNVSDADLYTLSIPAIPIRAVACSISQASIVVPMGHFIPKTRFSGPGSTDTDIPFPVVLDCDSAARVNIQLDGATVGGGVPGVLKLNAEADVATGLGVQVLLGGTPVTFGTPLFVGTSSMDGPFTIDFIARYYQVDGVVESGVANATATFTMTYN